MLNFAKPTTIVFFIFILSLNACSSLPLIEIGSNTQRGTTIKLANGLVFYKVSKGGDRRIGSYILSSKLLAEGEAKKLNSQLNSILSKGKYQKLIDTISIIEPIENDPHGLSLGKLIQLGKFDSIEQAEIIQRDLANSGVTLNISHTSLQGSQYGLFEISILKLTPKNFQGQLISVLGNNKIATPETTSSMAHNKNAIAAVNAGFFVFDTKYGVVGDPAGISVINGELISEAVAERPALLIKNFPQLSVHILEGVKTKQTLIFEDEKVLINGINRTIGKILNCGQQTENKIIPAIHDHLCESTNEIVLYDDTFGELSMLKNAADFSFFIDKNNKIYGVNDKTKKSVPQGHYLIRSIGAKAKKLTTLIKAEQRVKVDFKVVSKSGEVKLEKGMYIVNGGPTLLLEGKENIAIRPQEGWDTKAPLLGKSAVDSKDKIDHVGEHLTSRKQFYYNWVVRRHPRTAVGITQSGDVYIVVIYGRNPKESVGASVTEMAKIMKSLNVDKAMNLDGGGSSVMIVDGKSTGIPSDVEGERAVGDALLFLPSK